MTESKENTPSQEISVWLNLQYEWIKEAAHRVLGEGSGMIALVSQAGYRVFTDSVAFRRYVEEVILAEPAKI